MRASILKNGSFELAEIEKPVLSGKGAIVKVIGCGLCGSDIVKYTHNLVKDGTVLGHEVVGEIVDIDSDTDFMKGEVVAVAHHYPCFKCNFCRHGNYSMCREFKKTNISPGGFSEYIMLDEGHLKYTVFRLSDSISIEKASFTEPLACCYRAARRMNLINTDKVVVVGLGSIGLLMGQACKVFGVRVIGFDVNPERLKNAEKYGFDDLFNPNELNESIGADAIFLTAGANSSIKTALDNVRDGGQICVFASTKDEIPAFQNNEIYYRELKIYGSYSPAPSDLEIAFLLLKENKVNVDNILTHYTLSELNQAISDTMNGKILKAFITMGE